MPGIFAQYAERIILKKRREVADKTINIDSVNVDTALQLITEEIEEQNNRKKSVEDKAKGLLLTITISITAITFSLNYHKISLSIWGVFLTATLLISILYFISATIRIIHSMDVREWHVLQIKTEVVGDELMIQPIKENMPKLQELIRNRVLNDDTILIQANFVSAAYRLVRNGIICFSVYFIFSLTNTNISLLNTNKNNKQNSMKIIQTTNHYHYKNINSDTTKHGSANVIKNDDTTKAHNTSSTHTLNVK